MYLLSAQASGLDKSGAIPSLYQYSLRCCQQDMAEVLCPGGSPRSAALNLTAGEFIGETQKATRQTFALCQSD